MALIFTSFDEQAVGVVAPYFRTRADRLCDRTVGVNFMWRAPFDCAYAVTDGCLILRVDYGPEGIHFTYPIGGDAPAALRALRTHCDKCGIPMRLATVTDRELAELRTVFSNIEVDANRDYFDYLYYFDDLATFAGRRYSAQRNHINRFGKLYPDRAYHPLTATDVPTVKAFLQELIARKTATEKLSVSEEFELKGCVELLDRMHDFGMVGGYLTVSGNIVAFSVGEVLGDTLYVHIEKGDIRYAGVYQVMVREFAANNAAPTLRYINREDDSGDEGLRKSKLAYRPCALLEKNQVLVKQEEV